MKYIKIIFTFLILGLITFSCLDTDVLLGNVFSEEDNEACEEAQLELNQAAYQFAFTDSLNYAENCQAYAAALETVISTCGDEDNILTPKLDALLENDCVFPGDDCNSFIELSAIARDEYNNSDDTTFVANCTAYKLALKAQKSYCGDPTGVIQTTINDLDCTVEEEVTCEEYEAATANCNAYKTAINNQLDNCGSNSDLSAILVILGDCEEEDCSEYETATENAEIAYDSDPTPANCNAYKDAINDQLNNCGPDTELSDALEELGDCEEDSPECVEARDETGEVKSAYDALGGSEDPDPSNPLWVAACQAYSAALQNEIDICELDETSDAYVIMIGLDCN